MREMTIRGTAVLALLVCTGLVRAQGEKTLPYGFRSMEIYKLTGQTRLLHAADVNGDGTNDLLIANNGKARIDIFLRRKTQAKPEAPSESVKDINELASDRFYDKKEILTEKEVTSLATGDFNGDGHVDVAYYGKPAELVVTYGNGKGGFGETRTFDIDDGSTSSAALAAGDLNGDGRDDLALLAKNYTAVLYQDGKGNLKQPAKIPLAEDGVSGLVLADLDGDHRIDLIEAVPASERSVHVRFQRKDGTLGPEVSFRTAPWRFLDLDDVDPRPGTEVLAIQRSSGLLRVLGLETKKAAQGTLPLGQVRTHPFPESVSSKPRDLALGDLDGDGRLDVVVTEPGTAQVALYDQGADGTLAAPRYFPSLSAADAVRTADLDGNGRAAVIVLSSTEKAVGISRLGKDGALPFPEILHGDGVPKAMDVGDLNGDGKIDLAVVSEKDGKRYALLYLQKKDGGLADPTQFELKGLKQAPDGMMVFDLDQDGRADLLLFDKYGPTHVWRAKGDGTYVDVSTNPDFRGGLIRQLDRGKVNAADLDGDGKPELLVASENFARSLRLGAKGSLEVEDQANGRAPTSKIQGAVALDLDGDGKPEVALYDADGGWLTVMKRGADGVFHVQGNLPLGRFDYRRIYAADVNGDGKCDLVLLGKDRFGVFEAGGSEESLQELHSYESPIKHAELTDLAVGDLNGDRAPDVALVDDANNMIEIASYDPKSGLQHRTKWKVFEQKFFEGRNMGSRGEPREILVNDLDGDGLDDIAILVHDRLIVYLQASVPAH